jgi:low affinity Fe/Cu permease
MTAEQPPERESLFERIADFVSAAMGRPKNIIIWAILVIAWTLLFALGGKHLASGTWMPGWFTSTGFNFPLNLITTVAELFIGFLVAAASNRSERNLNRTLAAIGEQERQIETVEDRLADALDANTQLTSQVHDLATQIHALVSATAGAPAERIAPAGQPTVTDSRKLRDPKRSTP